MPCIALKAEIRVPGGGAVVGWCKPIIMSNPQPSCFGLLLSWVAVALLGFGIMTITGFKVLKFEVLKTSRVK